MGIRLILAGCLVLLVPGCAPSRPLAEPLPRFAQSSPAQEYAWWVSDLTLALARSDYLVGGLLDEPRRDRLWDSSMHETVAAWRQAYQDACERTPPPQLASGHRQLVTALRSYATAADYVDAGVRQDNTDLIALGVTYESVAERTTQAALVTLQDETDHRPADGGASGTGPAR